MFLAKKEMSFVKCLSLSFSSVWIWSLRQGFFSCFFIYFPFVASTVPTPAHPPHVPYSTQPKNCKSIEKQECIPVRCVPSAAVAVSGGCLPGGGICPGGVSLGGVCLQGLLSEGCFLSISGWSRSICCINLSLFLFKKIQASLAIYKACISTRYQRSTIKKATSLFTLV